MSRDSYVPLSVVMEVLVNLCPDCRHEIQARFAAAREVPAPKIAKLDELITEVASLTAIPRGVILSKSSSPPVVKARRSISVRARELGYSLPQIGAALNKHHTTILHLLRTHAKNQKETTVPL